MDRYIDELECEFIFTFSLEILCCDEAQNFQVHLEVLRPWVAKKVIGYLGMEDDIIINMVIQSCRAKVDSTFAQRLLKH